MNLSRRSLLGGLLAAPVVAVLPDILRPSIFARARNAVFESVDRAVEHLLQDYRVVDAQRGTTTRHVSLDIIKKTMDDVLMRGFAVGIHDNSGVRALMQKAQARRST